MDNEWRDPGAWLCEAVREILGLPTEPPGDLITVDADPFEDCFWVQRSGVGKRWRVDGKTAEYMARDSRPRSAVLDDLALKMRREGALLPLSMGERALAGLKTFVTRPSECTDTERAEWEAAFERKAIDAVAGDAVSSPDLNESRQAESPPIVVDGTATLGMLLGLDRLMRTLRAIERSGWTAGDLMAEVEW